MRPIVLTLSLVCFTLFNGSAPIGFAQMGGGPGGMGPGGMGPGGMGPGAPGNRTAATPPTFAVVDLPIDEHMEELTEKGAKRLTVFHYELGSYKPTVQREMQLAKSSIEIMAFETKPDEENGEGQIEILVPLELAVTPSTVAKLSNGRIIMAYPGGMGGYGMGMGGGMGMGMEGGMGGMMGGMEGGGEGGYGGGGMEDMGGYGSAGAGGGAAQPRAILNISGMSDGMGMPGMGAMGGYGDEGGMTGGGEGGMGMGMMGLAVQTVRCYVPLITLTQAKEQTGAKLQLPPQEVEVVSSVIRQNITRRQLVESLHRDLSDTVAVEKIEVQLKQLLAEEYDTQLKRQELEISEIEKRASELRQELGRRKAAKERVVDVQLGRIILEAQGLLGK